MIFFLSFAQNIDCGYPLERLNEAVLTCTHNQCQSLSKNKKTNKNNQPKIVIFTAIKIRSISHRLFIVMYVCIIIYM